MKKNHCIKGAVLASLFVVTGAQAAGFQLIEQSASGMGNAFAGGAAVAEDASTIYFNPAGMTYINGTQAVGTLICMLTQQGPSAVAQIVVSLLLSLLIYTICV